MTEWWRFGNIVEQQNTVTRNKAVSMIDRLATEKLRQQRERESLGADINQARQERLARSIQSWRKEKAIYEINQANQKLLQMGADYQIPVSDSSISQQLSSGRTWADNMVKQGEIATEEARTEAMYDDAEEWAKWEQGQTGISWAKLNPTQKQEQVDYWFNKVATGDLPSATVAEEEAKEDMPSEATARREAWGTGVAAWMAEKVGDEETAQRYRTSQEEWQSYYAEEPVPAGTIDVKGESVLGNVPRPIFRTGTPLDIILTPIQKWLWGEAEEVTRKTEKILELTDNGEPVTFNIYPWSLGVGEPISGVSTTYSYNVTSPEQAQAEFEQARQKNIDLGDEGEMFYSYNPDKQRLSIHVPSASSKKESRITLSFALEPDTSNLVVLADKKIVGTVDTETEEIKFNDAFIEEVGNKYAQLYGDKLTPIKATTGANYLPDAVYNVLFRKNVVNGQIYPSVVESLGAIGAIGSAVYIGVAGVQAIQQFLATSPRAGQLYSHLPGVTLKGQPPPPKTIHDTLTGQVRSLTVKEIQLWKQFQQTDGYQNFQTIVNAANIQRNSVLYKSTEEVLYRAFQYTQQGRADIAQNYLDAVRALYKGWFLPSGQAGQQTQQAASQTMNLFTNAPQPTSNVIAQVVQQIGAQGLTPDTVTPALVASFVPVGQALAITPSLLNVLISLGFTEKAVMTMPPSEAWATAISNLMPGGVSPTVSSVAGTGTPVSPATPVTPKPETVVKPTATAVGTTAKEPWQMTNNEYITTKISQANPEASEADIKRIVNQVPDRLRETEHKGLVQQALSENKPVPLEVLKDYPEFQTTALAEGETGDIIPEGVMQVTGLEPIKAIKAIETQYAAKKIQYEATKKALIDYAKEHLPLEARGRMLSLVKNVKTELGLQRAIAQADRYAEVAAQKNLRTQITKELSRITPKRQATGYRYGKFTAETQKSLNQIKANTALDRENVKAEILRNIQAAEDGTITFEQADEANEILAVSGLKGMTSDELAYTLGEVKSLKETGRGLRATEREAEIQRIEKVREDVINTITGGKGIKPGGGTIPSRSLEPKEGRFAALKGFATNWQFGLDDVGDSLSKLDKTSKPFQSSINQLFNGLHISRSVQQGGTTAWIDVKTADKVKEIYGLSGKRAYNDFLYHHAKDELDLGTFATTEGHTVSLKLTKDEIITYYLQLQDPTLDETFRVGMKWTDEIMSAVKDSMTAEDLQLAEWLSRQYSLSNYGGTIKPVFEAKYHIPMPQNPNYSPRPNRDVESSSYAHILQAQDNYRSAGVANNSLKARHQNKIPLKPMGALAIWTNHVIEMEHFKAFASSMKEARMVFGNQDVRTAIKQYHGQDILSHLDRHLNDIARDGRDKALVVKNLDKLWDLLRRNFTTSVLVSPLISLKQALSLPAYLTYEPMPLKDFFTGVADFWKHPRASVAEMKSQSGYFTERWGRGHERDIRFVARQGPIERLKNSKNWREHLMTGIKGMDNITTQPGSWSVYKSMQKQKLSKPEAILHAELATKRSQPSFGLEDMAALRKQSPFWNLMTMFQSQPNKYYRLIANSARNLKYGRGDKKRQMLNIILAWWLLPMMFQYMTDAFQWKKEHQIRVAALGPLNYLLAAGQLIQSMYGWITDEPYPYQPSPVFGSINELQWAISGTVNLFERGQDPTKDIDTDYLVSTIEHYAKFIGQVTGAPSSYAIQVERAIRDADIRQMIFSQYALKNEGDAVKSLQDMYAQAYGYNKWSDLPDEQKNRFYELRPDLK